MIKITDEKTNNVSSKFIESNNKFYILGTEYDKNSFEYTPLKIFNNGINTDTLILNQILYPYALLYYFQNIKNNNILVDSNDKNIIYTSPFGAKYLDNGSKYENNYYKYINQIITNDRITSFSSTQTGYSYYNNNIVNFLGQSKDFIYCSNVSTGYSGASGSNVHKNPNDSYWNGTQSNSYRGKIVTNIMSIPKNNLSSHSIIHTIQKCYGNIKIIKDTDNEIYLVCGCYDSDQNNQFQIIKLLKENNTCEIIYQDKKDVDNSRMFDVVTPSDVEKIDDNTYKFYLNLMERSFLDFNKENFKHYNYIYECIFNTDTHLFKKNKIYTENLEDLPDFGTYAGTYYNEIYHLKKNGNDYLVTSKNSFVNNNDSVDNFRNDRIISYYKINNEIIEDDNVNYDENIEINLIKKNNGIYESNLIKKNNNIHINIVQKPKVRQQVSPAMTNYDTPNGYKVTESSHYSSYYGYYVFDNTDRYWGVNNKNNNDWIELSFPEEVRVNKVIIRNYSTSCGVTKADINGEIINNITVDSNNYEYNLPNEIKSDKIKFTVKGSTSANNYLYIRGIRYLDDRNLKFLIKSNNTIYTINNSNELIEINENVSLDKINTLGITLDKIDFNIIPNDFVLLANDEWISPLKISYEKVKTMTLLENIYKSDINGDYYGMLFNKKNQSFLAISSNSSYIFDVNSTNFDITDLEVKAEEIGIDLEGNNYIANQDTEIYIYGKNKINKIVVTQPEEPDVDEIIYPYTTNIKVSSYNYKGERIKSTLKHTIIGTKSVKFKENNGRILIKDTSANDDVEIEIIVTEDSLFEINTEFEL